MSLRTREISRSRVAWSYYGSLQHSNSTNEKFYAHEEGWQLQRRLTGTNGAKFLDPKELTYLLGTVAAALISYIYHWLYILGTTSPASNLKNHRAYLIIVLISLTKGFRALGLNALQPHTSSGWLVL